MGQLSMVSKEMAHKLLQEVGFEDRIIGTKMSGSAGNSSNSLYSLKELGRFLRSGTFEELSRRGHSTMCYINLDEMLHWIGEIYGDKELADAMAADMEKVNSLAEKLDVANGLLEKRLKQCEEVLAIKSK